MTVLFLIIISLVCGVVFFALGRFIGSMVGKSAQKRKEAQENRGKHRN